MHAMAPVRQAWIRRLTSPWAAAVILAAFWMLMLASLREKSITFDEVGHMTAGYTYWRFNDYRLDPENGNLPQRVAGLPLLLKDFRFPSTDSDAWRQSDYLVIGYQWLHRMGNDVAAMLASGRAACGLMAVAMGALVWIWSRRINGSIGAMLSLALFVLSPTILANGALMTSDTASALFFLAACMSWWAMLHRLSAARIIVSGLVMGALFITKSTAVLMAPMALLMVAVRLFDGRPLPVNFGAPRELLRRGQQTAAFAAAGLVHVVIVIAVIWAVYGFRFSAFADAVPGRDRMDAPWEQRIDKPTLPSLLAGLGISHDQHAAVARLLAERSIPTNVWTWDAVDIVPVIERTVLTPEQARRLEEERAVPPAGLLRGTLDWMYRNRLLPESYLLGQARVLTAAQLREAFLNGHYSLHGWISFFPYTVLVKTPLPVFGVILLAIAAAAAGWRTVRTPFFKYFYDTLPLWALLAVYWAVIIPAHINIGHRHVLATYPPAFVLCGAAAEWLTSRTRAMRAALIALVVLLAAEVLWRFPDYLAYFNVIAGGPAQGYRHLVDSSLDWGQDLPGVKRYIDDHHLTGPTYLSYFGPMDPNYYHIPSHLISSYGFSLVRPLPTPVLAAQVPADDLDAAKDGILGRNSNLEFGGTGMNGDREIAIFFQKPGFFRLQGGTYFISATLLQSLEYNLDGPWGPWNDRYEATYQQLYALVKPFMTDDPAARWAEFQQGGIEQWMRVFSDFEQYRTARLAAYLRHREPDDSIGYSILVYRLSDADVSHALDGPPPEHGEDTIKLLDRQ
jgi:hypothetical protein